MKGLLGHHDCVSVELGSIEENCATTEGIVANSCSLGAAEAWVERALELPLAVCLLLEKQRHVVEAASDVSVFANEATCQDRVSIVYNALGLWLSLACNNLCCEFSEVDFTVMGGKGKSCSRR